ncbi:MAG: hypothetical protein IPK82_39050 [Polyangiaceae bacterium]|nr:hypothetical protein [Polyangiaceae bacterium]
MRRVPTIAKLNDVYSFKTGDGRYGAVQVIGENAAQQRIELLALNYDSEMPPTMEVLADVGPFERDWGAWKREPARITTFAYVPWWATRVGENKPFPPFKSPCSSYGAWQTMLATYHSRRYKRGNTTGWKSDITEVEMDLGAGAFRVRRDSTSLIVGLTGLLPAPTSDPVKWNALDVLPYLTEITYQGSDARFVDYVRERKIRKVDWRAHRQTNISLENAAVQTLTLEVGPNELTIKMNDLLDRLQLNGRADRLTVDGAQVGFPFSYYVYAPELTAPPKGLDGLQIASYGGLKQVDTHHLTALPTVVELSLSGAPGTITDAGGFNKLTHLKELTIYEMYGLDVEHWPESFSGLDVLRMKGLKKADADKIKALVASVPRVDVTGARTDEWLATNLENPFRNWSDDGESFGKVAINAWKKAKSVVIVKGKDTPLKEAEAALKAMIVELNRLDDKRSIDTIRREEAGDAFMQLAEEAGVAKETAEKWFDAWREF